MDEKAGLRRDAIRSQIIDALEAQEIQEPCAVEGEVIFSSAPGAASMRKGGAGSPIQDFRHIGVV
jgi:hypothetical protein